MQANTKTSTWATHSELSEQDYFISKQQAVKILGSNGDL